MNNIINTLLNESDILLEVLDARFPKDCRIPSLEKKIIKMNKKLILVLNKADLVDKDFLEKVYELFNYEYPTVYVSYKKRFGSRKLRRLIKEISPEKEKVFIGIFGYPNTGKSSLINFLVGRKRAGVSPIPGFTKGIQYIRLSKRFLLIDSPGIIVPKDKNLLVILGAIDPNKVDNPIIPLKYLYDKLPKEAFENSYGIKFNDFESFLSSLREKFNIQALDWENRVAVRVLIDWQKGKIRGYWL